MNEPRQYLGQVTAPVSIVKHSGVPDTSVYAANDVLFRSSTGEAFLLPCVMLGKEGAADLRYIIIREKAVGGAVVKANIDLHYTRIGGTDWVPPAANAAFSGPSDMEDYLGKISIVTADYQEVRVAGAIAYAIARVPVPDTLRTILIADEGTTDLYMTPTIASGTPTFGAAGLISIEQVLFPI